MSQSSYFLSGEGDNWFLRNKDLLEKKENFDIQFLSRNLNYLQGKELRFLEIGCSSGVKTSELANLLGWKGFGIDPSSLAISKAMEIGGDNLAFAVATADTLPFEDGFFDLVYFAFCLYLIDREQIESVFTETLRVLKQKSSLAILDFDYGASKKNIYKHDSRLFSFKDDYTDWIQKFELIHVAKENYLPSGKIGFASNPDERVAINLYRRK